jgi:hypothetical protein
LRCFARSTSGSHGLKAFVLLKPATGAEPKADGEKKSERKESAGHRNRLTTVKFLQSEKFSKFRGVRKTWQRRTAVNFARHLLA